MAWLKVRNNVIRLFVLAPPQIDDNDESTPQIDDESPPQIDDDESTPQIDDNDESPPQIDDDDESPPQIDDDESPFQINLPIWGYWSNCSHESPPQIPESLSNACLPREGIKAMRSVSK